MKQKLHELARKNFPDADFSKLPDVRINARKKKGSAWFIPTKNIIEFASDSYSTKLANHELIHWYLWQAGKKHSHTQEFWKWSKKLKCGDDEYRRRLESRKYYYIENILPNKNIWRRKYKCKWEWFKSSAETMMKNDFIYHKTLKEAIRIYNLNHNLN